MDNTDNTLSKLIDIYAYISEALYQKGVIACCDQVGIIEYNPQQNINKYLVLLPDYYHCFQYKRHKESLAICREATKICDVARKYDLHLVREEYNYIENVKKLFNVLKKIEFEDPITADYYNELIAQKDNYSFHQDLLNYRKEKSPPARRNHDDWVLGSFLESRLMDRSDAPVYANTFFSLDDRVFAVAVFILGSKTKKYDENCESLLFNYFREKNITNTIEKICTPSYKDGANLDKCRDFLNTLKGDANFLGEGDKINKIISDIDRIHGGSCDNETKKKIDIFIGIQAKRLISKEDIQKY